MPYQLTCTNRIMLLNKKDVLHVFVVFSCLFPSTVITRAQQKKNVPLASGVASNRRHLRQCHQHHHAMAAEGKEQPAVRLARLLKDKLVPRMVSRGVFGSAWQVQGVEAVPIGGQGEDYWSSTTLATTLKLAEKSGNDKERSLVVKCMLPSAEFDVYSLSAVLADNEVAMYNKVFPFLERLGDATDLYPKCYFAESDVEGLLSLTVMQDLRADGFSLAKERVALDKNHVMLALRAVGRLHAFSYAAKARCRREFLEHVVPLLSEPTYTPAWHARWSPIMAATMLRGVARVEARLKDLKAVKDEGQHQRRLDGLARMRAVAQDAFPAMQAAVTAQEPAGVIVHGDFSRNNMTFHYGEDGLPDQVRFFDFQTCRYCSPSVDLAFFIFMNTSPALRAEHWDALFVEYFSSLKATLDGLLDGHPVDEDFVMPTLQGVREDFRRHAIMSFIICSFFMPQMMMRKEDIVSMQEVMETGGKVDSMLRMGGEAATEVMAGIVLEFLDRDLVP
ncbi:uncharacterized protein LOC117644103 isoform X2 [Thrips palmi]|uniref:Uncharacterized protein LOC117644103 isoform X2 n=1 Tax=Thrips palmi TaxID=161013 RepID=A0A6P8YQJ6_THRPL|nr:uncharacterized protein LOC117644103 isoform X2 [Thrips palmi]